MSLPRKQPPCQRWLRPVAKDWHGEKPFENGKDLDMDHYEVRSFIGWYRHMTLVLVALAYLAGICATERFSTGHPTPSEFAPRPAALALTRVFRAPFARSAHLAFVFIHTPGARLVVVASVPPKHSELFPHQTASEGWLILAGSHHPLGFVLARAYFLPRLPRNFLDVPEFLEIGARVVSHRIFSCA